MSLVENYLVDGVAVHKPDFRAYLAAQEILSVKDPEFGAVGDDVADDIVALKAAQEAALALKAVLGSQSVTVWFPDGSYKTTSWLPFVSGLNYKAASRKGARIHCTGTTAAVASATYAAGDFTDNLDAVLGDITDATQDVVNSSWEDIHVDHTGTIAGNAPSGAAWTHVMQLVGVPDCLFRNIDVTNESDNIGSMLIRFSWRAILDTIYLPRGGAHAGGNALSIESRSDNVVASRVTAFGDWDVGVDVNGCNGAILITPDTEVGCDVGVATTGGSCIVIDTIYAEGVGTAVRIGAPGSPTTNWEVRNGFMNDNEYGVDVVAGTRGKADRINFQGTFSGSHFKMTGTASDNYNNDFFVHVSNAFTVNLTTEGLMGGRNRIHALGEDGAGEELIQLYRSTDGGRLNTAMRVLLLTDGVGAPAAIAGVAHIYIDTADGDLKVRYGDGVIKTIVVDT